MAPTKIIRVRRSKKTGKKSIWHSIVSQVQDSGRIDDALFQGKVIVLEKELGGARLAKIAKVDRSRITRWKKGEHPDAANVEKINGLDYVFARLRKFLAPGSEEKWLYGVNGHLNNNRPIDLLMDGRVAEVISAIEQSELGSYA